ncbi:MAG TPA: peptidylprolyl isomerase [Candidatus Angelobacter sp.]
MSAEARRHIGELYVRMVLLSQQALNEHLDLTPALRSQLELQRAKLLAQAEYEKMRSEVKVSQEEIGQYYTAHQQEFDTIQVRQFVVRKEPAGAEGAEPGLTAENPKTQAESIRKALAAGADAEKVAADFAATNVMLIDPKPRTLRRSEMIPALEKATFELRDGEVSEPVDTPQAFLVVLVLKHHHLEQKEATTEIEKKLQRQKLDAEFDDLRRKAGVWMDEDYFSGHPAATPGSAAQPPASAPTAKP